MACAVKHGEPYVLIFFVLSVAAKACRTYFIESSAARETGNRSWIVEFNDAFSGIAVYNYEKKRMVYIAAATWL